jgi:hypothetical protein
VPSYDIYCTLGCAVIFASKRNEAKRKRNFFRFHAKKSAFFACFASMRNVEIWSETKMKWIENKMKKKREMQSEKGWSENVGKSVKKNQENIKSSFSFSSLYPLVGPIAARWCAFLDSCWGGGVAADWPACLLHAWSQVHKSQLTYRNTLLCSALAFKFSTCSRN